MIIAATSDTYVREVRMRNDVSIPPDDVDLIDTNLLPHAPTRPVSTTPIPPPEKLVADVELFNHPSFAPTGAGNFWLLGFIGVGMLAVVAVIWWLVSGLMK